MKDLVKCNRYSATTHYLEIPNGTTEILCTLTDGTLVKCTFRPHTTGDVPRCMDVEEVLEEDDQRFIIFNRGGSPYHWKTAKPHPLGKPTLGTLLLHNVDSEGR